MHAAPRYLVAFFLTLHGCANEPPASGHDDRTDSSAARSADAGQAADAVPRLEAEPAGLSPERAELEAAAANYRSLTALVMHVSAVSGEPLGAAVDLATIGRWPEAVGAGDLESQIVAYEATVDSATAATIAGVRSELFSPEDQRPFGELSGVLQLDPEITDEELHLALGAIVTFARYHDDRLSELAASLEPVDLAALLVPPTPGARVFGSSGCEEWAEIDTSCAEFDGLKACLEAETGTDCVGETKLVDCTELEDLPRDQRLRCLWKVILPNGHPARTQRRQIMTDALCAEPGAGRRTMSVQVDGQSRRFGLYPIGYYDCRPVHEDPPEHTVSCQEWTRYYNDEDDMARRGGLPALSDCAELSTLDPAISMDALVEECVRGDSSDDVFRTFVRGPCPTADNFVVGCRRFRDADAHTGVFYYDRYFSFVHGPLSDPYQVAFYREQLRCIDPEGTNAVTTTWPYLHWFNDGGDANVRGPGQLLIPSDS